MFENALRRPKIDADDIRLAEGFRSPFWVDDIAPEDDPLIIEAVSLFDQLRHEFSSTRTQLALYGVIAYAVIIVASIGVEVVADRNVPFVEWVTTVMTIWLLLSLFQGWRIVRLIGRKDRAVDAVANDSMHRYEEWLENLRKSDPEEYIRVTTWESDVRHIQARIKMNEYF